MQTRGEQMLALRRARMAGSPAWLRGGFRPFFLGGAVWAVAAMILWIAALAGAIDLPSGFDPLSWHRHEMLFGFIGAIVAGFLLTMVPNWTGHLPIAGNPLLALFLLWACARIVVLFSAFLPSVIAPLIDVGFFLILGGLAGREVLASAKRNRPVVALVLLLGVACAFDHAGAAGLVDAGLGSRAGISLVVIMISVIGGRIIPSFTRNRMAKDGAKSGFPGQPDRFDRIVVAASVAAFSLWTISPFEPWVGWTMAAAALLQAARLGRWRGHRILSDPLVVVLHLAYAWLPIGLGLLGASILGTALPMSAAIHALTAGAMGTMILAVMTRTILSQNGRDLTANPATLASYVLVTAGAALRVASPLGIIDYRLGMELAAAAWAGAFLLFLFAYGPLLSRAQTASAR